MFSETQQAIEQGTQTTSWELDPAHSSAEFSVRHMMISTVTGRFKSLRGSILMDGDSLEGSKVEAEIDAASVDTGIADRDNHLKSADFLDVANHPTLTFRSTRIVVESEDEGRMDGELTIRGTTRPVSIKVAYLGEARDPWGNVRRGYTAETTLNRKDFGVNWNQVLDAGGVLVGDKVKVTLNIEAVQEKA